MKKLLAFALLALAVVVSKCAPRSECRDGIDQDNDGIIDNECHP